MEEKKKEFLDKQELIKKCQEIINIEWNKRAAPVSWADAYEDFIDDIEEMPAANVSEIKNGQWIFEDDHKTGYTTKAICSCCKEEVANNIKLNLDVQKEYFKEENPFCRKCGAKMDKE